MWNAIIFSRRNKTYGAYELRSLYNRRMSIGLIWALVFFIVILFSPSIYKWIIEENNKDFVEEYESHEVSLSEPPAGSSGSELKPPVFESVKSNENKSSTVQADEESVNPKVTHEDLNQKESKSENQSSSTLNSNNTSTNSNDNLQGVEDGSKSSSGDNLSSEVYRRASQAPLFSGCENESGSFFVKKKCSDAKLINFLKSNIKFPSIALRNKTNGVVLLQFIIEKNGSVSNIKILHDIGDGCGNEAVRVLELLNSQKLFWSPALQGSNAIRFQYTLPVEFEL